MWGLHLTACAGFRHPILVSGRPWLNGHRYDRFREGDIFQHDLIGCIAKVSPVNESFETKHRTDISRKDLIDVFTAVCIHAQQTPNPLTSLFGGIIHRGPLSDPA